MRYKPLHLSVCWILALRVKPKQPLMRGSDVLAVQTQLLAKGYAPGKLYGVYGNITRAAVGALQTVRGIKADGVMGRYAGVLQ